MGLHTVVQHSGQESKIFNRLLQLDWQWCCQKQKRSSIGTSLLLELLQKEFRLVIRSFQHWNGLQAIALAERRQIMSHNQNG